MEENTPKIISRKEAKAKGLTRYYTGKPCKHGHISERFTYGACCECKRLLCNSYRAKNFEKLSAKQKAKRQDSKEVFQQRDSQKYQKHRERHLMNVSNWTKENRGKRNSYEAARREKEAMQLTDKERSDLVAIYEKCRRLNVDAGVGHLNGGLSAYHVDHIIPLAKGGAHHPDNLQILSAEENLKKGDKLNLEKR